LGFEHFAGQSDVTGWSKWRHLPLRKASSCNYLFFLLKQARRKSASSEHLIGFLELADAKLWPKMYIFCLF